MTSPDVEWSVHERGMMIEHHLPRGTAGAGGGPRAAECAEYREGWFVRSWDVEEPTSDATGAAGEPECH